MAFLEIRSFPPPRTRNDVVDAIIVQIGEVGALGPKLIAKLDALKGVEVLRVGEKNGTEDRDAGEKEEAGERYSYRSIFDWKKVVDIYVLSPRERFFRRGRMERFAGQACCRSITRP